MTSPAEPFFAPPNGIDITALPDGLRHMVTELATRVATGDRSLLPARIDGHSRWYGLAPTAREARLLREEMNAWIGSPLSTGPRLVETATDALDKTAQELVRQGTVFRADITHGYEATARRNVQALLDVWGLAPQRNVDQPRPVGRVLRQFYEALLGGDRRNAESALEEMKARSLLSPTNLRFLRVDLVGALGTPTELRDDPLLQGISLLARPQRVTERLADAANALIIEPGLSDPSATYWPSLADLLERTWPQLVSDPAQATSLATSRCYALSDLVATGRHPDIVATIAARNPDDPFFVSLGLTAPIASPDKVAAKSAFDCYQAGEYSLVLDVAENETPTCSTVSTTLAAAVNMGDSAAAVRALAVFARLSPTEQQHLRTLAVERSFIAELEARTSSSHIPTDWRQWLQGEWIDRPDLLAEWASTWPPCSRAIPNPTDLAIELLEALHDQRRGRVRNGLSVFVRWMVSDNLHPSNVALATDVFDILLSSEPGRDERVATLSLLEQLLAAGPSTAEYTTVIDAVSNQLRSLGPRDAGWLADSLDLLLLFASPDPSRRTALVAAAAGTASAWLDRLSSSDRTVLAQLFAESGNAFAPPLTADPDHAEQQPRTGSVAIYSLLESASRMATSRIRALHPQLDVRTSTAHVNSEELRSLVRNADIVFMQTSHAKHAATDAIRAAATDPAKIVPVHGRGATALVRAFLDWAHASPTA